MRRILCLILLALAAVVLRPAATHAQRDTSWARQRERLVELVAEGVQDERVLASVGQTERHLFVPPMHRKRAYLDVALPIGSGATISPPHIVAFMTEQLSPQPTDKVLEIGTGSGYQAAILSPLVAEVYSIEIIEALGKSAAERLRRLGYKNVFTKVGDGFAGWPENAPFDKIVVTCSPENIPQPLIDQLREGGKMVIPVGERFQQSLCLVTKRNGKLEREILESTFFIPMTGEAERLRSLRNDDGVPQLINGSFEEALARDIPSGWYYLRQLSLVKDDSAPDGEVFLKLENDSPERAAQALQAFGLDGRRFRRLKVALTVKRRSVRLTGSNAHSGLDVRFYDEKRRRVGGKRVGPWAGSSRWSPKSVTLDVPPRTRLAVLAVGLFGASGELHLDNVRISFE